MMDSVRVQKDVRVVGSYDVVVCGGGPAGFIAAIAAAREGAKTAIIERYGFFGGLATSGYVTPISVFSYNGERNIGGIPWEFVERLRAMGGAIVEEPLNNIAFDIELYKLCAQRMVIEAGVDMYMNSVITDCIYGDGSVVSAVVISNVNGSEAIEGRVFIDASGDASVASMVAVPMLEWHDRVPMQPASMCFILSGVDTDSDLVRDAMHHNKQGVNCHCLPAREKLMEMKKSMDFPVFGGPWFCSVLHDGSVAVNMTRTAADACDNRDFMKAECQLREDVFALAKVLKDNFREFRNSYVSSVAVQAGARETRHIRGVHTISADEYVNAFRYEDSVSRCAHPIDIHSADGQAQSCTFLKKAAYVPYRSMIAKGYPNLIVAGRTISADCEAFASIRVQASCMGIGQAAGVAASLALLSNAEDIDISMLTGKLRDMGACLD